MHVPLSTKQYKLVPALAGTVHHRSGAGRLAAYRLTLQYVPTGAAPALLIPVVAVVFICGLSDVLINEYLFIYFI